MRERSIIPVSGTFMLLLGLGLVLGAAPALIASAIRANPAHPDGVLIVAGLGAVVAGLIVLAGIFSVDTGEARVMTLFGRYIGTVREPGLRWTNPLNSKLRISLRRHNFETAKIKVNDIEGNPIEIASVVVWKVTDTAHATFQVDNYVNFVQVQAESAVRNLATHFPYDTHEEGTLSLRGNPDQIAGRLKQEIANRVEAAGVDIVEARIAHLAYAPEIAQAMLQRQQAGAIIAARTRIVEGAVSMVEMALHQLAARGVVELDPERKAQMVSNLLVVLCGERSTQPVINTGSLY